MAYLRLLREMWYYAGLDRWKIVLFMACHFIAGIPPFFMPLVFARILNVVQEQQPDLLHRIIVWGEVWAALWIVGTAFHRLGRYLELQTAYRVKQRFINAHYAIITDLPMKWHTDHHSGETINRLNTAADAMNAFTQQQFTYIDYFMKFWGPLIGLALFSWRVSIFSLVISIVAVFIINHYDQKLVRLYKVTNDLQHLISSTLFDYIGNIRTIVTLKLGLQTGVELDHRLEAGYKPYMLSESWVNGLKWFFVPLCEFSVSLGSILLYIVTLLRAGQPVLAGNITAIYQYSSSLAGAFSNIAGCYQQIIHWDIALQTVTPIREALDLKEAGLAHGDFKAGLVVIENLTFRYGTQLTLDRIDLAFMRGDRIALVGESGSGKSSLMAVMRGLYEPESVRLEIDGRVFDTLAPLASLTTLIPQEPEIFENTIRYNITFGVEHGDVEVLEAIRLARFDPVLERLPHGLETDVRERGVTLSGGERQRLALARGILAAQDSSIILMDEPTSSVDAYNEAMIYENLFEAYWDKTIISSIHRLHLLGRFNRVIVMDQGRVVQSGSFAELKDSDGPFQTLWSKSTITDKSG
jgi:ABC-type multidrug transport system fused ATPase/permease subunit